MVIKSLYSHVCFLPYIPCGNPCVQSDCSQLLVYARVHVFIPGIALHFCRIMCCSVVLICNTSLFKRRVIHMGVRLYNKIPTKIQQVESFRDFKLRLKLFLLDHPFYLLNKFTIEPVINNTSRTRQI